MTIQLLLICNQGVMGTQGLPGLPGNKGEKVSSTSFPGVNFVIILHLKNDKLMSWLFWKS